MIKNKAVNILTLMIIVTYLSFTGFDFFVSKQLESATVTLDHCIDGDTASFIVEGKKESVRFLSIDTPETVKPGTPVQPFGKESSTRTCELLSNADEIKFEYEESDRRDKYNRLLAWVFVDDNLLQLTLVEDGLAKISFEKQSYKYLSLLEDAEISAKKKKLNIWANK